MLTGRFLNALNVAEYTCSTDSNVGVVKIVPWAFSGDASRSKAAFAMRVCLALALSSLDCVNQVVEPVVKGFRTRLPGGVRFLGFLTGRRAPIDSPAVFHEERFREKVITVR